MEETGLDDLLKNNLVPLPVIAALKAAPFSIKSIKQLANYFENKADIKTAFLATSQWAEDGPARANLTMAWREAEATVERGLKHT
eukprot:5564003-Heterocapsa_arctica.AAC.1